MAEAIWGLRDVAKDLDVLIRFAEGMALPVSDAGVRDAARRLRERMNDPANPCIHGPGAPQFCGHPDCSWAH